MQYLLRVLVLFVPFNTAFCSTCLRIESTTNVPGWFDVYNSCGASLSGDYFCTPSGKNGQFSVSKCKRTQLHCKAEDGLSLESVYVTHGNPNSFCLTDEISDKSNDSISGSQTMKNINSNLESKYNSSPFNNTNTNNISNDSLYNTSEFDDIREMHKEFEKQEQKLLDEMYAEIENERIAKERAIEEAQRNRNLNQQNQQYFGSFFGGLLQGLLLGNSLKNNNMSGYSTSTPNYQFLTPPSIPSTEVTKQSEKRCQIEWSGCGLHVHVCSDGSKYTTGTREQSKFCSGQ